MEFDPIDISVYSEVDFTDDEIWQGAGGWRGRGDADIRTESDVRAAGGRVVDPDGEDIHPCLEGGTDVDAGGDFGQVVPFAAAARRGIVGDLTVWHVEAGDLLAVEVDDEAVVQVGINVDGSAGKGIVELEILAQVVGGPSTGSPWRSKWVTSVSTERTWAFKPATIIKIRLPPSGAAVDVGHVLIVFPYRCGLEDLRGGGRQVVFAGRRSPRCAPRRCAAHPVAPFSVREVWIDTGQRVAGAVWCSGPFSTIVVVDGRHHDSVFVAQGEGFSGIAERVGVRAINPHCRRNIGGGRAESGFINFRDQNALKRLQNVGVRVPSVEVRECEGDSIGEIPVSEIERSAGIVGDFDEIRLSNRGVVLDFGENHLLGQR